MQYPVDELAALIAAIESQSEHPLARSALQFAQERLAPESPISGPSPKKLSPKRKLRTQTEKENASKLENSELETELVPLASPAKRRMSHTREWLREASDVQPVQGKAHILMHCATL